jgi:nucleoside-diphosphate-sugar epimerase
MPVPSLPGVPVLVTGGAGFIGSHLVDALLAAGAAVRVLDNFATGREDNLRPEAALVRGDLRDPDACREACRDVRFVFHQAALGSVPRSVADPATTIAVNVTGTANLFAAAREAGVQRIVYASSSSVYGDSERLPKREGEEGEPLSPYAFSKRAGEELARVWARTYSQELFGLRYFNVYGPRQDPDGPYAAVIPRFFRAALRGEPLAIFGDGEQSRDFTFVSDAVAANLLAAGAPAESCGGACNVASGRRTPLHELASRILEITGSGSSIDHLPPRPGDVRHSLADLQAAGHRLGYAPSVPLDSGLRQCRDALLADP